MFNALKNKIIVALIKSTHLHADVYYSVINKTSEKELENYIKLSKTH
jgi:hypothetical protein